MAEARWEIYKDTAGKYRWRLFAANNRKVASSGEDFSSKFAAEVSIIAAQKAAESTRVDGRDA